MEPCPHWEGQKPSYLCGMYKEVRGNMIFIEDNITEEEWVRRDVPEGCDMYAEYFVEECNNAEA